MIDCRALAAQKKQKIAEYVERKNLHNVKLAIIQVGENPASDAYVRGKIQDCEEIGIQHLLVRLDGDNEATVFKILDAIWELSQDKDVWGIVLQLPLPEGIRDYEDELLDHIPWKLDIDGLGQGGFLPPTARAVAEILESLDFNPEGKTCCVIGRGKTAGWPIANMLEDAGATVIWCNSKTNKRDLEQLVNLSELVVSCTGVPGLIGTQIDDGRLGRYGRIGIDVGIARGEDGKLCGDFAKELYDDEATLTPVPGGVGLMTRVALLENLLRYKGGD